MQFLQLQIYVYSSVGWLSPHPQVPGEDRALDGGSDEIRWVLSRWMWQVHPVATGRGEVCVLHLLHMKHSQAQLTRWQNIPKNHNAVQYHFLQFVDCFSCIASKYLSDFVVNSRRMMDLGKLYLIGFHTFLKFFDPLTLRKSRMGSWWPKSA